MGKEEEKGKGFKILETLYIPVPYDTRCVTCNDTLSKGVEAIQSPSVPNRFYHLSCFRELVRSTGKDPDKFIKFINPDSIRKN